MSQSDVNLQHDDKKSVTKWNKIYNTQINQMIKINIINKPIAKIPRSNHHDTTTAIKKKLLFFEVWNLNLLSLQKKKNNKIYLRRLKIFCSFVR